jgi:hypothetical protein
MPSIFISYRREDSQSATGRLAADLARQFGTAQVFRDLEAIAAGDDFRTALTGALNEAEAVLVIIGPHWLELRAGDGTPRLAQAEDYVRWEIEAALARNLPIIPVLIEGASMPAAESLPASIRELAYRQAQELSPSRWDYDQGRLRERLTGLGIAQLVAASPTVPDILRRALVDAVTLIYHPKSVLLARSQDSSPLPAAIGFLLVTQLIAGWILPYQPQAPYWQFLATFPVMTLLAALYLSGPLYLAWRMVGAPRQYARMLTILLYQLSFLGFGYCVAGMILITGAEISAPQSFARLMDRLRAGGEGAIGPLWAGDGLGDRPGVAWIVGGLLASLLAVLLLIWFFYSWAAFRAALQRSALQSAAALVLFQVLVFAPLLLMVGLALVAA